MSKLKIKKSKIKLIYDFAMAIFEFLILSFDSKNRLTKI